MVTAATLARIRLLTANSEPSILASALGTDDSIHHVSAVISGAQLVCSRWALITGAADQLARYIKGDITW